MLAARVVRPLLICSAALLLTGAFVAADVLPHGLKVEKFVDSTAHLGDLAQSPTGELWLLERGGSLRVMVDGKQVASLSIAVSTACDAGLLDVAFPPDYGRTGEALVYYVDTAGEARVDQVIRSAGGVSLGAKVLSVGSNSGGCRMGGGMVTGPDGKIYVATGDLETSGDAQLDASLSGKVLRMNPDGSVPADNPDPASLVFAKGFRQGADLAINPATARSGGTVYGTDVGQGTVYDEINAVAAGGNYAWDADSGNTGGSYDDPLVAYNPVVGTEAVATVSGAALGTHHEGSSIYACTIQDELREAFLSGPERDALDHTAPFFDPDGDRDGTADPGCPHGVHALAMADDGLLYMANDGANPGVWRVWHDTPGAREVSAPGSLVQLTASAANGDVTLGWEKLSGLDAGLPARNGGQHVETYTLWEGGLPITGAYSHSPALTTNGSPDGPARLTATLTPASGNRYFLVSAQGDNMEGATGADSNGAARPTGHDYCDDLGWGHSTGLCAPDFQRSDGTPVKLIDENPSSPTFGQALSMADFRGNVVRMDISADNCFWCRQQAPNLATVEEQYGTRDVEVVTVFLYQYGGHTAYADEETCKNDVAAWASQYNATGPILCDIPIDPANNDMHGVVSTQYGRGCGTPENFYIDQSGVFYDYVCGAELSAVSMMATIEPEANPETCE